MVEGENQSLQLSSNLHKYAHVHTPNKYIYDLKKNLVCE